MKKRVVVLGAGISGLARAWALQQRYGDTIDLTLLESAERAGGWIQTQKHNSFLFELGPRSCRSSGTGLYTLQLIEKLGLTEQVISASSDARFRYLWIDGKLQQLPTGIISLFFSPLTKGLIKGLFHDLTSSVKNLDDPSIKTFIEERLGDSVAERLFDPLVTGIYAGDIDKLSIRSCFPSLFALASDHGSLTRGTFKKLFTKKKAPSQISPFVIQSQKSPIFSLKKGMGSLVDALASALSNKLKLNVKITSLHKEGEEFVLTTQDGKQLHADELHIAIPAYGLSSLLKASHATLSSKIDQIETTSLITVNMGWKNLQLHKKGFGYLIPSKEKEDILGVVWDSSAFPMQNHYLNELRLTAMIGGAHRPDLMNLSDDQVKLLVYKSLSKHLSINNTPDNWLIHRAINAIPQYTCGHHQRVMSIFHDIKAWSQGKIALLGHSWKGVSVNDCIAEAIMLENH